MEIGEKIAVTNNSLGSYHIGVVTQIEICFFKVRDELDGNIYTYHWNDDIELTEKDLPL